MAEASARRGRSIRGGELAPGPRRWAAPHVVTGSGAVAQDPPRRMVKGVTACLLAVLVGGCIAPIRVQNKSADVPEARVVTAERLEEIATLGRTERQHLGAMLDTLRRVSQAVAAGDSDATAEYNYLTGRVIERWFGSPDPLRAAAWQVDGAQVKTLELGAQPPGLDDPERRLIPTDRLVFHGRYVRQRRSLGGIGSPLIAVLPEARASSRLNPYRPVTAVVRFHGSRARLDLIDPFTTDQVRIGERWLPLQADFHAPVAYLLSKERIDRLGFVRLIRPAQYDDTARIAAAQPYDPDKIPVLLVHGLQDTPASFAPMYFELMNDPVIRRTYQFWVFSYPSGYPYPMSAAILRRELDEMHRLHPGHRDLVIVGHSMGGLIARLMITDVGERLWIDLFGQTPERTRVGGESRRLLEECLIFEAREDVSRAIFIAAPHRGSELARNLLGWVATKLIQFPNTLADLRDTLIDVLSTDFSGLEIDHFPNSVDTLSPENRFVRALQDHPIRPGIPYHSIIGDRGRGDTPDSSDGVVAYWSSHLEGATSEKVVPSWHWAHQNPDGIAEVARILRQHASPSQRPSASQPRPLPGIGHRTSE